MKCIHTNITADAAVNAAHVHAMVPNWHRALEFYKALLIASTHVSESLTLLSPLDPSSRHHLFEWLSQTYLGVGNTNAAKKAVSSAGHLRPECLGLGTIVNSYF